MMMGKGNVPIRSRRVRGILLLAACLLTSVETTDAAASFNDYHNRSPFDNGFLENISPAGRQPRSTGGPCLPSELIPVGIAVLVVAVLSILLNCCCCCWFVCCRSSRQESQHVIIVPPYSNNNATVPENNFIMNNQNAMPEERSSDLRVNQQDLPSPLSTG